MEVNSINNNQPDLAKPAGLTPGKKITAIIIALLVILGLLFFGMTRWANKIAVKPQPLSNAQNPAPPQQQAVDQGKNLIQQFKLGFPPVSKLNPATLNDVPAEDKIFLLPNTSVSAVQTIDYAGGQKGFFVSYTVPGSNPQAVVALFKQAVLAPWQTLTESVLSTAGLLEYTNTQSLTQTRVTLSQPSGAKYVIVSVKILAPQSAK